MRMTLVPAYGRDYTSKAKVLADLKDGKDFIISDMTSPHDGLPANAESLKGAGVTVLNVRYKQNRNVAVFKIADVG